MVLLFYGSPFFLGLLLSFLGFSRNSPSFPVVLLPNVGLHKFSSFSWGLLHSPTFPIVLLFFLGGLYKSWIYGSRNHYFHRFDAIIIMYKSVSTAMTFFYFFEHLTYYYFPSVILYIKHQILFHDKIFDFINPTKYSIASFFNKIPRIR